MPFFRDEMDVRDELAEGIFTALVTDNPMGDVAALARRSYNAAEIFITERTARRRADRHTDLHHNDDDEVDWVGRLDEEGD